MIRYNHNKENKKIKLEKDSKRIMKNDYDSRMKRLARAEERTVCKQIENDKEKIQKRIDYLRRHLEELQNILETEDFRE